MLPSAGPLHRVWAGTKLLGLVAPAAFVSLDPQWPSIIATAAAVLAGLFIGHVPPQRRAATSRWVVTAFAVGLMANLVAGGRPDLHLGPLTIGLGAAGNWLRATTLGATMFTAAALEQLAKMPRTWFRSYCLPVGVSTPPVRSHQRGCARSACPGDEVNRHLPRDHLLLRLWIEADVARHGACDEASFDKFSEFRGRARLCHWR